MTTEDEACVAGALASNLRAVLIELAGKSTVEAVLARLPRDVREDFVSVTPLGWVRISSFERVFGETARELGRSTADLHTEVARLSIERTFRTVWRVLLRLTTDGALISRTPVIFARSYDRGRLRASIPIPGRGEITLEGWPDAPDWPLRATRIGVETVLRIAGRKDVRVSAERAPDGAIFLATWR